MCYFYNLKKCKLISFLCIRALTVLPSPSKGKIRFQRIKKWYVKEYAKEKRTLLSVMFNNALCTSRTICFSSELCNYVFLFCFVLFNIFIGV